MILNLFGALFHFFRQSFAISCRLQDLKPKSRGLNIFCVAKCINTRPRAGVDHCRCLLSASTPRSLLPRSFLSSEYSSCYFASYVLISAEFSFRWITSDMLRRISRTTALTVDIRQCRKGECRNVLSVECELAKRLPPPAFEANNLVFALPPKCVKEW